MAIYVAFLRAINLGATRKFPLADVVAATEAAGGADVATYLNTGNVRLRSTMRSRTRVEAALEAAYLADRGFEVPTMVFTPAELVVIAKDAAALVTARGEAGGQPGGHYVSLLKTEPSPEAVAALAARAPAGETVEVRGRAAHLMVGEAYHLARLSNAVVERHLGPATNRNLTVIEALAARWG